MPSPAQPIPIAFCITELDRGGAERALCQLVLGLDRTRWQPRVYCLGPRSHFVSLLEEGGVTVECFDGRGILSLPSVLTRLTRSLRRFRPAILQSFLFHANLLGRIAGRIARVPHIISGIRVAERQCRWHGRLDYWTNWLVDHNVCVSRGVADFTIESTGLRPGKLSVIPNGVDFDQFAAATPTDRKSLGIPNAARIIITVGRLQQQKGISFLLDAAAEVCRDAPDCHFLIVGEGPDRDRLETMSNQRGIANRVHFLGGRNDVPNLLAASDLFILPSLWEGMPNSLLEAMAAGLPVIATAVEGSREVIHSGVNGLLVPPASSEKLATGIFSVLNNPEFSERLAKESQHTVQNRFTTDAATRAYEALYQEILSTSELSGS